MKLAAAAYGVKTLNEKDDKTNSEIVKSREPDLDVNSGIDAYNIQGSQEVKSIPDSGNILKDKTITIGHLAQDIVSSTEKTILKQVLRAYPEIVELETEINNLTDSLSKDAKNNKLIEMLGECQNRFEALGGWSLEKKAKKILKEYQL